MTDEKKIRGAETTNLSDNEKAQIEISPISQGQVMERSKNGF